jgi:Ran-binding protein 3
VYFWICITGFLADDESEKKTLSESAAEYTESHANKRKYDVVDVVTGEEAESNVVQSQVKLYIFDKDKRNWTERGDLGCIASLR